MYPFYYFEDLNNSANNTWIKVSSDNVFKKVIMDGIGIISESENPDFTPPAKFRLVDTSLQVFDCSFEQGELSKTPIEAITLHFVALMQSAPEVILQNIWERLLDKQYLPQEPPGIQEPLKQYLISKETLRALLNRLIESNLCILFSQIVSSAAVPLFQNLNDLIEFLAVTEDQEQFKKTYQCLQYAIIAKIMNSGCDVNDLFDRVPTNDFATFVAAYENMHEQRQRNLGQFIAFIQQKGLDTADIEKFHSGYKTSESSQSSEELFVYFKEHADVARIEQMQLFIPQYLVYRLKEGVPTQSIQISYVAILELAKFKGCTSATIESISGKFQRLIEENVKREMEQLAAMLSKTPKLMSMHHELLRTPSGRQAPIPDGYGGFVSAKHIKLQDKQSNDSLPRATALVTGNFNMFSSANSLRSSVSSSETAKAAQPNQVSISDAYRDYQAAKEKLSTPESPSGLKVFARLDLIQKHTDQIFKELEYPEGMYSPKVLKAYYQFFKENFCLDLMTELQNDRRSIKGFRQQKVPQLLKAVLDYCHFKRGFQLNDFQNGDGPLLHVVKHEVFSSNFNSLCELFGIHEQDSSTHSMAAITAHYDELCQSYQDAELNAENDLTKGFYQDKRKQLDKAYALIQNCMVNGAFSSDSPTFKRYQLIREKVYQFIGQDTPTIFPKSANEEQFVMT